MSQSIRGLNEKGIFFGNPLGDCNAPHFKVRDRIGKPNLKPKYLPTKSPTPLHAGLDWPVRTQGVSEKCTAFAAAACLELYRHKFAPGPKPKTVRRYSAGFLHWGMSEYGDSTVEGWRAGARTFDDTLKALKHAGMCDFGDFGHLVTDDPCFVPSPKERATCPDAWRGGNPRGEAKKAGEKWAKAWKKSIEPLPADERPKSETGRPEQWLTLDKSPPLFKWPHDITVAELHEGRPVGMAFPNFYGADIPHLWMSAGNDRRGTLVFPKFPILTGYDGGHAVCVTGIEVDHAALGGGWFLFRNSLGSGWGNGGYGRISIHDALFYVWSILLLPGKRWNPKAVPGRAVAK